MAKKPAKSDEETVNEYMKALKHPLKPEMEALREILKNADKRVNERIKWNAPSYYFRNDIVTFNHRATAHVHLVWHHPEIESRQSGLLEGDYKGRRMMYLRSLEEVRLAEKEIVNLMKQLADLDDKRDKTHDN